MLTSPSGNSVAFIRIRPYAYVSMWPGPQYPRAQQRSAWAFRAFAQHWVTVQKGQIQTNKKKQEGTERLYLCVYNLQGNFQSKYIK